MLVLCRVTPSSKFVGTHLYTWVERGNMRKCLAQEHNTVPWPGLEIRPPHPEYSVLTAGRPPQGVGLVLKQYGIALQISRFLQPSHPLLSVVVAQNYNCFSFLCCHRKCFYMYPAMEDFLGGLSSVPTCLEIPFKVHTSLGFLDPPPPPPPVTLLEVGKDISWHHTLVSITLSSQE